MGGVSGYLIKLNDLFSILSLETISEQFRYNLC